MAKTQQDTLLNRRNLLLAGGGLTIAAIVPISTLMKSGQAVKDAVDEFAPNAFIRIMPDDTVTVLIKHIEFGQGPYTGLATLVAEELDADWGQMRAQSAPANAELYANSILGLQGVGGSTSMASSWEPMRKAGAAARAMLVAAAAKKWDAPPNDITIRNGVIEHNASGKQASFGDLAALAAMETAPEDPPLKDPKNFQLIGKSLPKLDTISKTNGSATFTLDVYRDNMMTAVVEHAPAFGALVASFDASAAQATPGVVGVRQIPQGVAVYAENTYAAIAGRRALEVTWDGTNAEKRSSAQLEQELRTRTQTPGVVSIERGDTDAAIASGASVLEAEYVFPFLAHAPMEPLDAVIEQRGETIEAWLGSQTQTIDHETIANTLGVDQKNVIVNTMLAGGSFGRRAQALGDFAAEAAETFKATDRTRPVKLIWTREDDIRGGFYRPLVAHRVSVALTESGDIEGWKHIIASPSILTGTPYAGVLERGADPTMIEGASQFAYAAPNLHVSGHVVDYGVPVLWWRSVGHTHNAFVVETLFDEALQAAGRDAVEGRMQQFDEKPRHEKVLKRAAELADWGKRPREGAAFGVAVHESFGTYVAEIAEVSMDAGIPRVHNVWAAVDCGRPVNRNIIKAQIEGGIGYGLGAMLYNEIMIEEGGRVSQSNFHDYQSLRMNEMPDVEVAIIDSPENPTGVGEPGLPPIAPAVANAVRRLTGDAHRRLPLVKT